MLRKAACVLFGVVAGVLANIFGSWADMSRRESQSLLGPKMIARSEVSSVQSTIVSVLVVVLIALVSASILAVVAKRRTG